MLAISGQLQKSKGGPGAFVSLPEDVAGGFEFFKWFPSDEKQQAQRTIYTFQRRSVMNPMIEVFDGANMSEVCSRRSATVVPTQAFSLLNGDFTHKTARHLAERMVELAGPDVDKQLDLAFLSTLARRPTEAERSKYKTMFAGKARGGIAGEPGSGVVQPERVSLSGVIMNFDLARRRFLYHSLTGVGGLALADVMRGASSAVNPLAPKTPDHEPKAKSCIFLTMLGGVSQMDSFDPKPALEKFDNTVMDWSKEKNTDQANLIRQAAADSAKRVSISEVRSMRARRFEPVSAHGDLRGRYGVCALDPDGERQSSGSGVPDEHRSRSFRASRAWARGSRMGWAPKIRICRRSWCCRISVRCPSAARSSGARDFCRRAIRARCCAGREIAILNLKPPAGVTAEEQSNADGPAARVIIRTSRRCTKAIPTCRVVSMPMSWLIACKQRFPGVLDMAAEPAETLEMYGLKDPVTESFGKRCLMARQMVEKGVRFVQLYTPSQSWDGHTEIVKNHTKNAAETDKPIAALLKGSEAAGTAGFDAGGLDGRIRPHSGQSGGLAEQGGTRSQHARHDDLDGGRRRQAGRRWWAGPTIWASRRWKTFTACAMSTRRSCI